MPRYHATLSCAGLTEDEGAPAPVDILAEFSRRTWHQNVQCRWDGSLLWLEAENDYDNDGRALLDEFWDVVVACVAAQGTIRFDIRSVVELPERT